MSCAKTATFNCRQYCSRLEVARELAQITGRTVRYLETIVRKHNGDGDAALRWWQTRHQHPKLHFEGREVTRSALARELAPQLALSVAAIRRRLRANGDDVEQLRRAVEQQRIVVDGTNWPNRAAFVHEIHRRYHPSPKTVRAWVKQAGFEAALA